MEDRTRDERQVTAVDTLADSELFFVDKVRRPAKLSPHVGLFQLCLRQYLHTSTS